MLPSFASTIHFLINNISKMDLEALDFYLNLFEKIGFKYDSQFLGQLFNASTTENKLTYLIKRGAQPTYQESLVKTLIQANYISELKYLISINYIPKDKVKSLITFAKKNKRNEIVDILKSL